jgi:hypothetical protein
MDRVQKFFNWAWRHDFKVESALRADKQCMLAYTKHMQWFGVKRAACKVVHVSDENAL